MLEEHGPTLPFPFSSQVEGKLREVRAHYGNVHYRVFYDSDVNRVFVLLHGLEKRTKRIPVREKKKAIDRMRDDIKRKEQLHEEEKK